MRDVSDSNRPCGGNIGKTTGWEGSIRYPGGEEKERRGCGHHKSMH